MEGMNPIQSFKMINFNYDIRRIISKEFEKMEDLDSNVVEVYLRTTNKMINKFNHTYQNLMLKYEDIPFKEELENLDEEIAYAKENNNKDLLKLSSDKRKKIINEINLENKKKEYEDMQTEMIEAYKKQMLELKRN